MIAFLCLRYDGVPRIANALPRRRRRKKRAKQQQRSRQPRTILPKCITYGRLSLTFYLVASKYLLSKPIECALPANLLSTQHSLNYSPTHSLIHTQSTKARAHVARTCIHIHIISLAFVSRLLYSTSYLIWCPASTTVRILLLRTRDFNTRRDVSHSL